MIINIFLRIALQIYPHTILYFKNFLEQYFLLININIYKINNTIDSCDCHNNNYSYNKKDLFNNFYKKRPLYFFLTGTQFIICLEFKRGKGEVSCWTGTFNYESAKDGHTILTNKSLLTNYLE